MLAIIADSSSLYSLVFLGLSINLVRTKQFRPEEATGNNRARFFSLIELKRQINVFSC